MKDCEGKLVEAYFTVVCPIISTFDSELNIFRTFVGMCWQHSGAMYYAMLSMAAAKLGRQVRTYRLHALHYQCQALQCLQKDVSHASYWNTKILFTVLMLGLSTCWHDNADLGLIHLKAIQQALLDTNLQCWDIEFETMEFFRAALTYWEMVASFINMDVPIHDYFKLRQRHTEATTCTTSSQLHGQLLKPHPWASIASKSQAIFARIVRLIQQYRSHFHESCH